MFTAIVFFGALKAYSQQLIHWAVAAALVAAVPYLYAVIVAWANFALNGLPQPFIQAVSLQGIAGPLAQLVTALVIFYLLEQNDSDQEHSLTTWLFVGVGGMVLLVFVVPYTIDRLL